MGDGGAGRGGAGMGNGGADRGISLLFDVSLTGEGQG